jgi:hypothetical protein
MHIDEERIQRLLHRELPASEEAGVRAHLERCAVCEEQFRRAEVEETDVNMLLAQLDHQLPRVNAEALLARSRGRDRWGRWAAGIVLVAGTTSAVFALTNSPLRQWLRSPGEQTVEQLSAPTQNIRTDTPDEAGIAVMPSARFRILFSAPQSQGEASVSLTDSAEVFVRARGGAATFTSDDHELVIANDGSTANYDIQLPRAATRIEIWVERRRVLVKEGSNITLDGMPNTRAPYVLHLRPSP